MKRTVDEMIRRQAGVIGRRQALDLGMPSATVASRVTSQEWFPLHTGVYLTAGHGRTIESDLWAGLLSTPGSVLDAAGAAWRWQLTDDRPVGVQLIVPTRCRPRPKRGVTIVRRDLDPRDVTRHRDMPVVSRPLAALYGAVAMGARGPAMLDRALQRSVRFEDVVEVYYRYFGCHGSTRAAELIRAAGDRAAAESERLLIRLLRQAGVGGFTVNQRMVAPDGQVDVPDFTFARERVLVYVDGWAWHHDPERFRRDRRRQNALALQGWTVLRFTWFDLVQRPDQVLAEIRQALAAGRRR